MKSLAFSLIVAGASLASAGTYTFTLPEFNGPAGLDENSTYPQPSVNVGVFNFAIPGTEVIVGAELDGQFGTSSIGSTAGVVLYGDGVLVAQALPYGPE